MIIFFFGGTKNVQNFNILTLNIKTHFVVSKNVINKFKKKKY